MPAQPLTDVLVRSLKPPGSGRTEITDGRCRGLTLRITTGGEKSWAFRYRDKSGRPQRLTLGRYPDLSLAAARARADAERRRVAEGESPAAEKRQERANADKLTFDHLADRYLSEHAYRFKKSAAEDERSLRLHLRPSWGRRRYSELRRRDVVEVIEGIYASGRHALAVRLKATISKVFSFAIAKDLVDANPAAGIGRIAELKPRQRVLSDDEIALAWDVLPEQPASPRVGLALRLVLATGQRPGEVAGMRASELTDLADASKAIWRIPASRSKNGREHTVPLTQLATDLVREAESLASESSQSGSDYLFPSPRGNASITGHALAVAMARVSDRLTKAEMLGRSGVKTWIADRPTPHDLRRTAATRMRALGTSSEDVKHVLNHAQPGVLGKHYDRYDPVPEKRRALEAWAVELHRLTAGAAAGGAQRRVPDPQSDPEP